MPNIGDKLYQVWDGKLLTATFIKEQIVKGATRSTWTVRKVSGLKANVSPDHYLLTELAAWKKYHTELARSGTLLVGSVKNAQAALDECIDQMHAATEKITQLST